MSLSAILQAILMGASALFQWLLRRDKQKDAQKHEVFRQQVDQDIRHDRLDDLADRLSRLHDESQRNRDTR